MRDEDLYYEDALRLDESRLPSITADANRAVALTREIERLKQDLEAAEREYNELTLQRLPEKMKEAGLQQLTLADGWQVEVKRKVHGALPKGVRDVARRLEALEALRRRGGAELIKNTLTVIIDRGKDNVAHEVEHLLRDEFNLDPQLNEDVHAQTLQAWAREQLRESPDVLGFLEDAPKIGLFIADVATIKEKR